MFSQLEFHTLFSPSFFHIILRQTRVSFLFFFFELLNEFITFVVVLLWKPQKPWLSTGVGSEESPPESEH